MGSVSDCEFIKCNLFLTNEYFICTTYNIIQRNKIEQLLTIANQKTIPANSFQITQIMPMHYFHTLSARLATCTELNLALVREGIATGACKKVDAYLYAVYRVRIRILTSNIPYSKCINENNFSEIGIQ